MADAVAEIEAAIREVHRSRQAVARRKSKQVFVGSEADELKAIAFAWFQSHRPQIQSEGLQTDFSSVDAAYQRIMEATGRNAARKTYSDALRDAKTALVALRTELVMQTTGNASQGTSASSNKSSTPESPPQFSPLATDPKMEAILQRRWVEVQNCMQCQAYLAGTVMMGGLLESLLLARINASPNQAAVFTAKNAPKDKKTGKTLPLSDWTLLKMVEVGHELGWISKSAKDVGNVLRDFRNYIHPHKEYTENVSLGQHDTDVFWQVTKAIARQVLASVGKTP